jgi:hypothetical protein
MVEFGVLGPMVIWQEGREVPLGAAKRRALLALLLLRANEVVSTARLVDQLWAERPPARAVKAVQVYVSQLRKALGDGVVETRPGGYRLPLDKGALDLDRFEARLERGRALLTAGAADEAAGVLREALGMWRGPALADFEHEAAWRPASRDIRSRSPWMSSISSAISAREPPRRAEKRSGGHGHTCSASLPAAAREWGRGASTAWPQSPSRLLPLRLSRRSLSARPGTARRAFSRGLRQR